MRYILHVITPVHVGDGSRLGRMDYVKRNDKLLAIDIQRLAALPEVDPEELSDHLFSRFDIGEFLQRIKVNPARVMKYSVDCRCDPQGDVLSCIKDCTGMAYIPGSSIKGALRTAVLWERIKNDPVGKENAISILRSEIKNSKKKKAHAAGNLEKRFLGVDPNHDHLRALRVSDSDPLPTSSVGVFNVEMMSLVRDYVDKATLRKKMDLFVEAIKPGTETGITIDLDEFLCREHAASKLNLKVDDLDPKELESVTRSYYNDYVRSEIEFFSNYMRDDQKDGILKFYEKRLPEKRGGMVLRVGWGGGWHGMTVARLFPEVLDDLRSAFGLGKRNVPEFPKTRRLARVEIDNDKVESQPMGWIWLKRAGGM